MYRPFCKQWLYFDRQLNEMVYQVPKLFPTPKHENLVISLNATDARKPFGAIITDVIPNLALSDPGQCFPLFYYDESDPGVDLFSAEAQADLYSRRDAITDATLARYHTRYGNDLTKADIFFYVYGLLHSSEYKHRFAAGLEKDDPAHPHGARLPGLQPCRTKSSGVAPGV